MIRATCAGNSVRSLPDEQVPRGSTPESSYPVTVGQVYTVFGIACFENRIDLLIRHDGGNPSFVPAALFEPISDSIPADWRFSTHSGLKATGRGVWVDPLMAVWGIEELHAEDFLMSLIELDEQTVSRFWARVGLSPDGPR